MIGFTSGAFAASVAQANYSAAKGGIVSLVRSAAAGMHKYGVTANCIAPVAKSRMSGQVPFGLEMGEPEDVAPMVAFLLGDQSRDVTGQVYTANGGRLAVWNQPSGGARDAHRRSLDARRHRGPLRRARPGADADPRTARGDGRGRGERRQARTSRRGAERWRDRSTASGSSTCRGASRARSACCCSPSTAPTSIKVEPPGGDPFRAYDGDARVEPQPPLAHRRPEDTTTAAT